jgi:LPXTG-motif cell wall-anchored protein
MKHRALVRVAVAALAVTVAGLVAASPAAAEEQPPTPQVSIATLDLKGKVTAGQFGTKSCEGVPGGAKAGSDGWVFDQPAKDAENYAYILGFVDKASHVVILGISEDGVETLEPGSAELTKTPESAVKSLTKAAATQPGEGGGNATQPGEGTKPDENKGDPKKAAGDKGDPKKAAGNKGGDDPLGGVKAAPAPAGVSGALLQGGGAWLRTPAGWVLAAGELLHDGTAVEKFHLVRTCVVAAPGQGGGTGESLPVTGTNIGIVAGLGALLVALGGALLVMRRRRTTKFVA